MGFCSFTPTQLRVASAGGWVAVNSTFGGIALNTLLPSETAGLLLHVILAGANEAVGFRKPGSADNIITAAPGDSHFWAAVGVSPSIAFEAYLGNILTATVWLVGYVTEDDAVFLTNAVDVTPGIRSSWQTVDLSIFPGAIGIALEITGPGLSWGVRKNGSIDNRTSASRRAWAVIGCDTNQLIQIYASPGDTVYAVGYITSGAVFNTNADDVSLVVPGVFTDINFGDRYTTIAFVEIVSALANRDYALRVDGSIENVYRHLSDQHNWGMVGVELGLIEGKIEDIAVDFYRVGYAGFFSPTVQTDPATEVT